MGVRGREWRAAPLDESGDPPLVANLVKTEMRLQVGAGKERLKWLEQSFQERSSRIGVLSLPCT